MTSVNTRNLRGRTKEELFKALEEQKSELASLKVWSSFGPLFRWLIVLSVSGGEGEQCRVEGVEHPYRPKEHCPDSDNRQPVAEGEPQEALQGWLFPIESFHRDSPHRDYHIFRGSTVRWICARRRPELCAVS